LRGDESHKMMGILSDRWGEVVMIVGWLGGRKWGFFGVMFMIFL